MKESLLIKNLTFSYKENEIIKNLNMTIKSGEIISLVGPNGAGKSTLIKLISGLLPSAKGEILLYGESISHMSSKKKASLISLVPQNPQLPKDMKLIDFISLGRNPHLKITEWGNKSDLEHIKKSMAATDTSHLKDKRLSEISGGELQRGMISLAIAQDTPIMLFDEPTSNLDLYHQTKTLELITHIHHNRHGITIIAIHDLTLAAQYTDKMIMLSEGTIFKSGTPHEVLTTSNIKSAYGAEVIVIPHPQGGSPIILPQKNDYPKAK